MSACDEQVELLRAHGAVLVRQRKHQVWRLPDGRVFVQASTPSDWRAGLNRLCELRRFLGLNPERGREGERRERRVKRPKAAVRGGEASSIAPRLSFREALERAVKGANEGSRF